MAALEPVWAAIERLRGAVGKAKREAPAKVVDSAYEATRQSIVSGLREDGRAGDEVRAIRGTVGYLPSNHGSALFTRGGTQALVSVTLASDEPAVFDSLLAKRSDRFFLHYNFPPYSVGEVRAQRGPGRREVGHGALAQRALGPVIPAQDELPFSIRVVSDILESDGSSSMATVCGASLALMDAGVPMKSAVAGIAMGVVIGEDGDGVVISDIRGVEDARGDMDLKVAGTRKGLTALQLDQKVGAVPMAVLGKALAQARVGLDHILDRMAEVIAEPRENVAPHAPQVLRTKIPQSRIGLVIGQGGKTISELQSATQTRIDVKDDGRVKIAARRAQDAQAALARIEAIVQELVVGKVYTAEVVTLKEYGAFVRIGDHEGLVHVSELAPTRVEKVEDVVRVGDSVQVKVIGADKRGRLELSRKAAL
jgi:polyribonucleotide nucleotidyltransferase